jgi:hypothetical protein
MRKSEDLQEDQGWRKFCSLYSPRQTPTAFSCQLLLLISGPSAKYQNDTESRNEATPCWNEVSISNGEFLCFQPNAEITRILAARSIELFKNQICIKFLDKDLKPYHITRCECIPSYFVNQCLVQAWSLYWKWHTPSCKYTFERCQSDLDRWSLPRFLYSINCQSTFLVREVPSASGIWGIWQEEESCEADRNCHALETQVRKQRTIYLSWTLLHKQYTTISIL